MNVLLRRIVLPLALVLSNMTSGCATTNTDIVGDVQPALRYPVVFVHGISSTGPINWRRVGEAYEARGIKTLTPTLSTYNTSVVRGEQLYADIEEFRSRTGVKKVHLVAHSQGGLDVREMMTRHPPDFVASVTTLSTPHEGSPIADFFVAFPDPILDLGLLILKPFFGSSRPSDGSDVAHYLTTQNMKKHSREMPVPHNIPFHTIAASTSLQPSERTECQGTTLSAVAPTGRSLIILPFEMVIRGMRGGANDGVIQVSSASSVGTFLGCVDADHLTQAGYPILVLGKKPKYEQRKFFLRYIDILQGVERDEMNHRGQRF